MQTALVHLKHLWVSVNKNTLLHFFGRVWSYLLLEHFCSRLSTPNFVCRAIISDLIEAAFTVSLRCIYCNIITLLFFFDTKDTSIQSSVNSKTEEFILCCFKRSHKSHHHWNNSCKLFSLSSSEIGSSDSLFVLSFRNMIITFVKAFLQNHQDHGHSFIITFFVRFCLLWISYNFTIPIKA